MDELNAAQVDFVRRHAAEERFRLRQSEDGKWSALLYWVRVLAQKD
jgi:hypothetical protein